MREGDCTTRQRKQEIVLLFLRYTHLVWKYLLSRRKWPAYSYLLSISAQSTRSIRIITYTDESCNLFDGSNASVQNFTERDPDKWLVGKETLENIIGEAETEKSVVYVAFRRVMALIL
jgi:hypothetical protein